MTDVGYLLAELRRTLANLALPPEEQLASLRGLGGVSTDELALEFGDDIVPAVPGLRRRGCLTAEEAEAIRAVDEQLRVMSGAQNARLWTEEGIRAAPEWDRVRHRAMEALTLLRSRPE